MTNRLLICGALAGAFVLCGCATTATTPSKSNIASNDCAGRITGSSALANHACTAPGVRSYTQADLQSTGRATVGEALPMLDPRVTVQH